MAGDAVSPRRVVVTLVHGTFARRARWILEGSLLRRGLGERLGPDCIFAPFRWTGGNSHGAREVAAERLRGHLRSLRERFPGSRHFVVAHSHGGNVASYAMQDEEARRGVSGLVFLATPFIVCEPRSMFKYTLHLAWISGGVLSVMVGLLVAAGVEEWLAGRTEWATFLAWLTGLVCGFLAMLLLIAPLLRAWVTVEVLAEGAEKRSARLTVRRELLHDTLAIRPEWDEASLWLRTLLALSLLPDRILDKLSRFLVSWPKNMGCYVLAALGIGSLLVVVEELIWGEDVGVATSFVIAVIGAPTLAFCYPLFLLTLWSLARLTSGRIYGVGESLRDSLLLSTRIDSSCDVLVPDGPLAEGEEALAAAQRRL